MAASDSHSQEQSLLADLAFQGKDITQFKSILDEKPVCLNCFDPKWQQTLIYAACRNGKLEFVRELLDRGCDLTLKSGEMKSTPAHAIVQFYKEKGDEVMETVLKIMEELLEHGQTMIANRDSATPVAELYSFLAWRPLVYKRGQELFRLLATNIRTYRRCGGSLADETAPRTQAEAEEAVLLAALFEEHLWAAGLSGVTFAHPKRREQFITFCPCWRPAEGRGMEVILQGSTHELRIPGWPGNDAVQWLWSPPERALWLAVDPEISQQLATEPNAVQLAAGIAYEVKLSDFTLAGNGPQDGWRLRWCPVEVDVLSCLSGSSDLDLAELLAAEAVGESPTLVDAPAPEAPPRLPASKDSPPVPPALIPAPPPPVKWQSFSLVPHQLHLKDGVLSLVVALPKVPELKELQVKQAPDASVLTLELLVPEDQAPRLEAVLDRLQAVELAVSQQFENLAKDLRELYISVATLCRRNGQPLSPSDPVRVELQKYYARLRADFQAAQEQAQAALRTTVAHRAPTWMAEVATNANVVSLVWQHLEQEVATLVQRSVPEFVSSVPELVSQAARWAAKVMKDHMLSQEPDWAMLSPGGKGQYDYSCKSILRGFRRDTFSLAASMRRYLIHLTSVRRGLPFYAEAAKAFLQSIGREDLCIVTTSTGSGKSTLMPLLLYAEQPKEGREHRIAVTQPRRFAAEGVCKAIGDLYGERLVGFRMAGKARNPDAPIVYITDGLLRTMLDPTVDFAARPFPFDTVVIDEVHERSMEIDACLALLAMQQQEQRRQGMTVTKVILSSATFDEEVMRPWTATRVPRALSTKLTQRFCVTEHYLDKHCATPLCSFCSILAAGQHEVDVVLRAQRFLRGSEQLLCFLPTVVQVNATVKVLQEHHVQAFPLYAQQSGRQQLEALQRERVFIATNIAETSLTFPNLKVVVDAGKVQSTELTDAGVLMTTKEASEATLNQRRGRAGRTCDGHYVALFPHASRATRPKQIPAKMGLEDPEALQYSLRRQLRPARRLTIPLPTGDLPLDPIDDEYLRLPPVGTMKMAKALLAAKDFRCELEVLHVAALKMTFAVKLLVEVLAKCPPAGTGDISAAVSLHKRLVGDVDSVLAAGVNQGQEFQSACRAACAKHGVHGYLQQLSRSIRLFRQLREAFVQEKKRPPFSKATAVTRALAAGFPEGVYGCMKLLDGPSRYYARLIHRGDGGDTAKSKARTIYSLHSRCSLKKTVPDFIFALEFMMFGDGLDEGDDAHRKRFATLQMVEAIGDITKFDHCDAERFVRLHASDAFTGTTKTVDGVRHAVLKGPLGSTVVDEIKLREALRVTVEPAIFTQVPELLKQQLARHFEEISSKKGTFQPLKNQWKNMYGTELKFIDLKSTPAKMRIVGRREDVERLEAHLGFWQRHVLIAPVVKRVDPYGLGLYQRPRLMDTDPGFAQRLHRVSSPKLTYLEKFSASVGPAATRETRMELVANIAINSFKCKLVGGFVRDWVVRGKADHGPYSGNFRDWVDDKGVTNMERFPMKEEHNGHRLLPKDLDFELPEEYFDPYRFISEVQAMDIEVNYHQYIAQRHVFLLECKRGPFTADFVESHFAIMHAVADLDANILSIEAPFHNMVGLKMKVPRQFTVDGIVEHCRNTEMVVMRADGNIKQRVDKMVGRGWRVVDTVLVQPDYDDPSLSSLTALKSTDALWDKYQKVLQPHGMTIQRMWSIHNTNMKSQFEALRDRIAAENNKDPNVRELFHGTKEPAARSILHSGFDDHCWNAGGYFGRGAYFADDPSLSKTFSDGHFFVCDVSLGRQDTRYHKNGGTPTQSPLGANFFPQQGCHSLLGNILRLGSLRANEYVVYRYGQALPKFLIVYA
eukprot:EG_transcript_144